MADYIEGKRPVIEALRADMPCKRVLLADNVQHDGQIKDILRKARQKGIAVKTVPRAVLEAASERGSHQGVMAEALPFPYVSATELIAAANARAEERGAALVVVLDHLTDAGNLGAIARSAEAVGASGLIIPNKRSARVGAATYKSSAGAINHLKVTQVANIVSALERFKKEGFWVAGASEHATHTVWEAPLYGKIALVVGNEADGISRLVLEACDFVAKLPQEGKVDSLNVAQAATAIMYEWARQCAVQAKH